MLEKAETDVTVRMLGLLIATWCTFVHLLGVKYALYTSPSLRLGLHRAPD